MGTYSKISTAALGLLMVGGITVPACMADSEAQLQASSFSQSNNGSEEARENQSWASTSQATHSERENTSHSAWEARGPVSTSVLNLHSPAINYPKPEHKWGFAPGWGGPAMQWQNPMATKPESTTKTAEVRTPHTQVINVKRSNTQLAAKPMFTSSSHSVIRRGTSANSRYSYIKKSIRQAEVPM